MEVLIFRVNVCDDEAFKAITKCDCCHEALNFGVTVCGDEAVKAVTKGDCRHEALTFGVTVCEDEAFTAVTKGECHHECGPDMIGQVLLSEKGERSAILLSSHRYREEISYENTARRQQLPTSQGERHQ